MRGRLFSWFLALALALGATPARPCSTVEGYVAPSSFELVRLADAIAIATPVRTAGEFALTFRIDSAVKGTPPPQVDVLFARFGEGDGIGMCTRTGFTRGSRYVVFLEQEEDGGWRAFDYPFASNIHESGGAGGEWMRMVRRYLALQRDLPPMEQISALRRMAESGRDRQGRPLSIAERYDIVDHLSAITPWKPTEWLLDLYGRIERGEPLPFPPRPHAYGSAEMERAVAAFLRGAPASAPEEVGDRRLQVLRALAVGDHPRALPLFERLDALPMLDARARGLLLRYFSNHGHYARAWQWIETRLMTDLQLLPPREAVALLRAVDDVQRGDYQEEGQERWRRDARSAARWPEMALALYWYQERALPGDPEVVFLDALDAIEVSDYRARPELTLALGATWDEDVVRWAIGELARPQPPSPPANPDDSETANAAARDLLPLRVLASSWHPDREPALRRAYCDGGERRRLVILALGQWGHWTYDGLLAAMAATGPHSAEEREWLIRAAVEMTARQVTEEGTVPLLGDADRWLLSRLIRGQTPGAPALACSPER